MLKTEGKKKVPHLFHGARGTSVPFGPHELERRGPLAEHWVRQNIEPVHFDQNCGVTQPGHPQTWTGVREVRAPDEVRLHHRQLAVQRLHAREERDEYPQYKTNVYFSRFYFKRSLGLMG